MSCPPVLDCQLTAIAADMVASFADSTQIRRQTAVTSDGTGGQKATSGDGWTTVATVLGMLTTTRFGSAREDVGADQIMAAVNYKWYGPATTDVRQQDQLLIDGRTFEVRGVALDTSGMPLEALLTELQRGQTIV